MVISIDSDIELRSGRHLPEIAPVTERRREPRYRVDRSHGTATILGDEDSRTVCRIVDVSRSGMRISLQQAFAVGVQVHVEWDGGFFVGDCCYRRPKGYGYILGLRLLSSNYGRLPRNATFVVWGLVALCRVKLKAVRVAAARWKAPWRQDSQN